MNHIGFEIVLVVIELVERLVERLGDFLLTVDELVNTFYNVNFTNIISHINHE